jgi:hypothetical protein
LPHDRDVNAARRRDERPEVESGSKGPGLERKFGVALALYVVLAVLVWFTIGEGKISVFGRLIEIRWVPIFILATFAFRTVMAMQADRIRRGKE